MANIIIRKKGNNLNSFKVAVTDLYLGDVKTTLDFTDTEKTIPMPSDTDEIGGVIVTLATGATVQNVGTNLLTGTSSELKSDIATAGREDSGQKATNGFQYAVSAGETYTYQVYLGKENQVDAYVLIGSYDENKNWYGMVGQGNTVLANTGGVSEVTFTIPNGVRYINLTPLGFTAQSTDIPVYWKEEKLYLKDNATNIKVNLYNSTGTIYQTTPVTIYSQTDISRNYISITKDTTIFEVECNTVVPEKEKLTITKGDFETNSGKYTVKVGASSLDPLIATLGFNDETITVDKPSDVIDFSTVIVSFVEGEIFESGYVEVYDKNKTLLTTYQLEYDSITKTAFYTYKVENDTSLMLFYIKFHELSTPDKVPTFNHTYSMLPSELEQLVIEGLGVKTPSGIIDLRGFMLNLLSFPFAIPPDLLGAREKIVLGEYDRVTEATTVKGDVITYSLGNIKVPLKYKNAYDFYSAETTLILPYTENVVLSPEYVIGATISIEYVVEVYKGTVNINVMSSKTDKPIYNGTTAIGRQVPFISYWKILGDESIYTSVYNNQTKATIEVKRKTPLQLEHGLDTSEYGTIGDFKGYIEVAEVVLSGSTMGGYEQEQLISILNKGVIL